MDTSRRLARRVWPRSSLSRDSESIMAEQLGTRAAVPFSHTDLQVMLERERLDVLHIATPPASHVAIARAAFAAGCHLFMEKPFALDAIGAQQIIDAAASSTRPGTASTTSTISSAPRSSFASGYAAGRRGEIVHLDCS